MSDINASALSFDHAAALAELLEEPISVGFKSFPTVGTIGEVGAQGWRALDGDLMLPVAVLSESAVEHNLQRMAQYCRENGVDLAPHGKTTMSPQLMVRQFSAGAWAVTVATTAQARVFHAFGARRIVIASQVVARGDLQWLAQSLDGDAGLEILVLVDSVAGVAATCKGLWEAGFAGRLPVLLELGYDGGRAGCRDKVTALEVASAVMAAKCLVLRGFEGFEGLMPGADYAAQQAGVDGYLNFVKDVVDETLERALVEAGSEILLTFGGSAYFDRVVAAFPGRERGGFSVRVVLRSGCYLTHDDGMYARTSPLAAGADPDPLYSALHVWSAVLAKPEPGLAIAGFGKRDASFDAGWPIPLLRRREGQMQNLNDVAVTGMNDQHAYLALGAHSDVEVGDLIGCGISHPCTTFDKWPLIAMVDEDYRVTGAVRTFF
ncbi:amino acid deaminase [Nakamurella antarctica]|uniref:Amino acid deaminase n=1 Tax=Nakamurella antarctica TaxID=1902245 RepID=A0A3G8ZHW0_9ACTN|nr:alanine racemase [Nakamurella antarctica]AZI56863.1 amino acid deaminase [Nakamurella antarctica]